MQLLQEIFYFILFILFAEVTNEILQTLPSTRQRNSLLAVGMNLNIPDEDPKLINQMPVACFKKRFTISSSNYNRDEPDLEPQHFEERENKIPRTSNKQNSFLARSVPMDCDDATPQNLSISRRTVSNSLMDLSFACEKERHHLSQPVTSYSSLSSFSTSSNSFSSSNSSLNASPFVARSISFPSSQQASVMPLGNKKPLQMSNNVKVVHVGSNPVLANANRWVGFGRSKTVIALVSPTNNSSSNCYPAVQTSPVSLVMKRTNSFN